MISFNIPLWITLNNVQVKLRLSVFEEYDEASNLKNEIEQKEGPKSNPPAKDYSNAIFNETFGYEIIGTGELNRIVEIDSNEQDSDKGERNKRFSNVEVCLRAAEDGPKKYLGNLFCNVKNKKKGSLSWDWEIPLTLVLNVPEVPFNKFCTKIISERICGLSICINIQARQENDVGAFGPPQKDDTIYISANDGHMDCEVKLSEIVAIVAGSEFEDGNLEEDIT